MQAPAPTSTLGRSPDLLPHALQQDAAFNAVHRHLAHNLKHAHAVDSLGLADEMPGPHRVLHGLVPFQHAVQKLREHLL